MKNRVATLIRHPLISGSSIVLLGSLTANFINYLFNLAMGRLLHVADYGLLISLTSFFVIFIVFTNAFSSIFAKFTAKYLAHKDKEGLDSLIVEGFKIVLVFALVVFFLLLSLSKVLALLFHTQNLVLLIISFAAVFFSLIGSLSSGLLQGKMRFLFLAFLYVTNSIIKLIVGIFLVVLGFNVVGGMAGHIVSGLILTLITLYFLFTSIKRAKASKEKRAEKEFFEEFRKYTLQFMLATLGLAVITNGDTILMRHFLQPVAAGQYAALSLMGKVIFYFTTPIYFVFFPLVAHKKEKNESVLGTLLLAGGIILLFSLASSLIYFLFPNLVLKVFFPSKAYLSLAPYLGLYSIYILIFSIAYLFNNFFLSIGKTGVFKINILCAFIFIFSISLFHANLFQIIGDLFVVSFLLLLSLIVYYKLNGSH